MYGPNGKPKRMTITIPVDTYNELKKFADEWHISFSEVVRLAISSNLKDYFDNVRYVDSEQAKLILQNQSVINKNICALFNQTQDVRNELRRIGINYNQQVKLMHLRKKKEEELANAHDGSDLVMTDENRPVLLNMVNDTKWDTEEKKIIAETNKFDQDAVIKLIERFEKAAAKAGEELCRFQE